MAGNDTRGLLDSRQLKYPGPGSFTWSPSPLPDGTDLGKGFIPESSGPNTNPNNVGGSPYIDPTTGKKFPGAPG
jgi:hypothetical protein